MIVGYECSKHGRNQKKIVMSASYDSSFALFYTDEVVAEQEDEINPISTLLRRCLDYFINKNKICPTMIILYRSGISDSERMRNGSPIMLEVSSIRRLLSGQVENACYRENYNPKFCFCVVNKRTEAKFFEFSDGRANNPKEGMVIDSGATYPEKFEFYMQPQYVNSGTATPTYFDCVYDNTGIPLEILENITYKMCYYYWNWSGAIREPAVLKFAEQANKFSSSHMKYEVRNSLKSLPYYI
jgi:aubergine-like protein